MKSLFDDMGGELQAAATLIDSLDAYSDAIHSAYSQLDGPCMSILNDDNVNGLEAFPMPPTPYRKMEWYALYSPLSLYFCVDRS